MDAILNGLKNRWLSPDANGSAGGAAGEAGTTPPAAGDNNAAGTQPAQNTTPPAAQQPQQDAGVTMTQEAFSAKMAAEKNQGRSAVLNELGVKDIDSVKKALALAAAIENSGKTPEQQASDEGAKAQQAEQRAVIAEQKLALYKAQAKDEFVDDVLALVQIRMNADKAVTFEAALETVKKAHGTMFGTVQGDGDDDTDPNQQQASGTGVPPGPKKAKGDAAGAYGKMAAAAVKPPEGNAGPDTFFKS